MINCKAIRDKLSEYVDHELSEEDTRLVEQHVSQCEACRETLYQFLKISEDLDILMKAEPPVDFLERLYKRIKKQGN